MLVMLIMLCLISLVLPDTNFGSPPNPNNNNNLRRPDQHQAATNSSLGFCLMTHSDSALGLEFLAYHLTRLPGLEVLVLFEDPNSPESFYSSLPLFARKSIEILRWSLHSDVPDLRDENYHGFRVWQRTFYSMCLWEMRRRGVDWAIPIDSDEFYVVDGIGMTFEESLGKDARCLMAERLTFDGTDSSAGASRFVTERFRSHALVGDKAANRLPKQIINVKKITDEEWNSRFNRTNHLSFNVHEPLENCERWGGHVNHYLRTKEEFYHRDDPRRGTEHGWFDYREGFRVVEEKAGFMTEWRADAERKWGAGWDNNVGISHIK